MSKHLIAFILASTCLLLSPAIAQRNTATVFGTATDSSGAVVSGVNLKITNDATNQEWTTVSDNLGNFILPDLPPGEYTLTATMTGFKQFVRKNLRLDVDQRPQINIVLEVGEITQNVTVEEAAPVVDSTHANVGGVVENVYAREFPLNGRQFLQLGLLLPGTSPNAGGQTSARGGGPRNIGLQAGGNRATNNSYLIDGADSFGFRFKNTSLRPSVASIHEFKVLESPYDAQYGVASGVQLTVITKSGTNELHGELFEFLRNDRMDARNFFDILQPPFLQKPPFRQNQFGGALGGPIIRNKTFFFGSYEGFRSRRNLAIGTNVPTTAQLAGDFRSDSKSIIDPASGQPFASNTIPAVRISDIARRFITFYPAPNTGLQTPNYVNAGSDSINDDQYTFRGDHTYSNSLKIFARYTYSNVDRFTAGSIPQFGTFNFMAVQNAVLGATYIFSPKSFLEVHISYNRENALNQSEQIRKRKVSEFGIPGLDVTPEIDGVPNVSVLGFAGLGDSLNSPEGRVENSEQFIPNYTHIAGRHTLRAGGNIWPVQLNRLILAGIDRGSFNFTNLYSQGSTGLPDFLLGLPQSTQRQVGHIREDARAVLYNFYGSDDIRVNPRLTVSLGLRYELRLAFVDKHDHISSFLPDASGGRFIVAGDPNNGFTGRKNRALYDTPKKNLAPRAAIAYSLSRDGKTVLRAGYGIFYNLAIFNSQYFNALNPPYVAFQTYQPIPSQGLILTLNEPFPKDARLGGQLGGQFVAWNFKQGYMQQWSFGIQRELRPNLGVEISYVGSKGTSLDGVRRFNQGALPGAANAAYIRPYPNFGGFTVADSFGDSHYHSLQTRMTKRYSNGLSFIAAYTYGHSIDNANGEGGGSGSSLFVQDTNNVRADRGNSDFDVRHRFTFAGVYELPFGWGKKYLNQLAGITGKLVQGWQITAFWQAQTGFPFTVTQSGNRSGTFASNERADLRCDPFLTSGQRTRERWFNTACFAPSPLGRFGNSGRNILRFAGQNNLDFSVIKQTHIDEARQVEFRGEFFNLPNHTQFGMTGGVGTNVSSLTTFGIYTSAQDARTVQLALRLLF